MYIGISTYILCMYILTGRDPVSVRILLNIYIFLSLEKMYLLAVLDLKKNRYDYKLNLFRKTGPGLSSPVCMCPSLNTLYSCTAI